MTRSAAGARRLRPHHVTIRVPWHDGGSTGGVCSRPLDNTSCLILSRIGVGRRGDVEVRCAGQRLGELGRADRPPLEAKKTVINFVVTCNAFERRFTEFLGRAGDILRFAALGTTERGSSGTPFRVDYLKASGAIGF